MNGVVVDLVQAKLSASDLINAYNYKATNQRYYPDLGRFTSRNFVEFLGSLLRRLFSRAPRRARTDDCLLRLYYLIYYLRFKQTIELHPDVNLSSYSSAVPFQYRNTIFSAASCT